MKATLFLLSAGTALIALSANGIANAWFFILPFFALFPASRRLPPLILAGLFFDMLSGHLMGIATAVFLGYGVLLIFFRQNIWGSVAFVAIVLAAVSSAVPFAFFIARSITFFPHLLFQTPMFTQGMAGAVAWACAGAIGVSVLLSWRIRGERNRYILP